MGAPCNNAAGIERDHNYAAPHHRRHSRLLHENAIPAAPVIAESSPEMSNIMSNSESQANKAARQADGEFVRDISTARNHIGDDQFPPEPGRYHLVVAFNW
jgi:hypothetical protein